MAGKFVVRTYGCQMNEHDSERIAGLLAADGYEEAADEADADLVVLNTCCIRENADNKLYGNLGHLKTWKDEQDGRQIVVAGCLSQKDREGVRQRAPYVDVVLGTHNVHRTAELVSEARVNGPITEIYEQAVVDEHALFPSALPVRREVSYAAWVTIQIGCDNSCAFCIVPSVRGAEISRPFDDVIAEVERFAADGVTEITLLGQNVNSYGRDLQLAARQRGDAEARVRPLFADLLVAAGSVDGIRRVRFTSPHPKDMRPETFAAMAATPEVCDHLHYPLQSGSDDILAKMHRGYTAERYLERLSEARRAMPDLAVSTDIIVGFPGETEDLRLPLRPILITHTRSCSRPVRALKLRTWSTRLSIRWLPANASSDFELSLSDRHFRSTRHVLVVLKKCSSKVRLEKTHRCCPDEPDRTSSCISDLSGRFELARMQRWKSPVVHRTISKVDLSSLLPSPPIDVEFRWRRSEHVAAARRDCWHNRIGKVIGRSCSCGASRRLRDRQCGLDAGLRVDGYRYCEANR